LYTQKPIIHIVNGKPLFLCGVHGNEATSVEKFMYTNFSYIIVNPSAILFNVRNLPFQSDQNRNYSNGESPIIPYLHNAPIVVDIHEAYGEYNITDRVSSTLASSLGRTVYANRFALQQYGNIIDGLTNTINYTLLTTLPYISGTIDEYCNNHGIPYVLIEISGQGNYSRESILTTVDKIKKVFE
jgi:hypothetical protein